MTGYGEANFNYNGNAYKLELRSLNGKNIDVRMRVPALYRAQELNIRKLILNTMSRGKIDFNITITNEDLGKNGLNTDLIKIYIEELSTVAREMDLKESDILSSVLRIPNVYNQDVVEEPSEAELKFLFNALEIALGNIDQYRAIEGESIKSDLLTRIQNIISEHNKVNDYIQERNKSIEEKIRTNLDKNIIAEKIDENRFEQEIIYYLEKLDINEEQVRLDQHCKYFLDVVQSTDKVKGKKLAFIAQEIGREINTLGSKAQHAEIQKLVVVMKDELEKLKEQLANVM